MSNTLTGLYPVVYKALNKVSRKQVGFIPAVRRDVSPEGVAIGQTVTFPVVPTMAAVSLTPSTAPPALADTVVGNDTMSISNSYYVPFHWTGEEKLGVQSYDDVLEQQFAQAFETLTNAIETDIAELYLNASRAYGTAGTTPFATINQMDDFAKTKQILLDNGSNELDLHLVMDNTAAASIESFQANLFKVNEAGSSDLLRYGTLGVVEGLNLHRSGQIQTHTSGTATGIDCTAVEPVGETTITVDGSDSGTVLAGDLFTNTTLGDGEKYVTKSATVTGAADGNIIINAPGLVAATTIADELGHTVTDYKANMAFDRNAIVLAARIPAPIEDAATDKMLVSDPRSGLTFEIRKYAGFHAVQYHVGIAWGVKMVKPEHCALLVG